KVLDGKRRPLPVAALETRGAIRKEEGSLVAVEGGADVRAREILERRIARPFGFFLERLGILLRGFARRLSRTLALAEPQRGGVAGLQVERVRQENVFERARLGAGRCFRGEFDNGRPLGLAADAGR